MSNTVATPAFFSSLEKVSKDHPRLFGSRDRLKQLAAERPEAYRRMVAFARQPYKDEYWAVHGKIIGLSLLHAIDGDTAAGREVVEICLKQYIDAPIETGHVPFGTSIARCGIAYDLCHDQWTKAEGQRLFDYMAATIDANPDEEPSTFHNGWYGYKNWGYGVGAYATLFDNPRAESILRALEEEYHRRAMPALKLSGDGGHFAEGFYIHYWMYEWLFFCEIARLCGGVDYYETAPEFYKNRAVACMFEMYPGISDLGTRRPAPMGDSMGRRVNNERDKELAARRILVSRFRDDPEHQVVHAYNEQTPLMAFDHNAYRDFLWGDRNIKKGDLKSFRLSNFGPGAGYVFARSSWDEESSYLLFHCGRRFTAHQHLDNNHFVLWKNAELLGDGGQYDSFESDHGNNIYFRTIAHNSILVKDPSETWPRPTAATPKGMRNGPPGLNDGGQKYPWSGTSWGHNGGARDPEHWHQHRELGEIAQMLVYEDKGPYVYLAGDATKSYSSNKLELFTRQIVFVRPGTFVVFDRVRSTDANFKKTLLWHPMKVPTGEGGNFVVTNGNGRLFIQTVLPARPQVALYHGPTLYTYDGVDHPPKRDTGPGPECRIEISPREPAWLDVFLSVLTTTDANVQTVPRGSAELQDGAVALEVDGMMIVFKIDEVGGSITRNGKTAPFGGDVTHLV
jgi:hypothetical protein